MARQPAVTFLGLHAQRVGIYDFSSRRSCEGGDQYPWLPCDFAVILVLGRNVVPMISTFFRYVGKLPVQGGERDLWLFVMVLSCSRAMWAEFVIDVTVHSMRRLLVRASRAFGGGVPFITAYGGGGDAQKTIFTRVLNWFAMASPMDEIKSPKPQASPHQSLTSNTIHRLLLSDVI